MFKQKFMLMLLLTSLAACSKKDSSTEEIIGTIWVLWQYKDTTITVVQPNQDTLTFVSGSRYLFNGMERDYSLNGVSGAMNLTLFGTKLGDLSGQIPLDFIEHGEIAGKEFTNTALGGGNDKYTVWLRKI